MRLASADEARLSRLRRLPAGPEILSIYLEIDPATALHHGYVSSLMDVLKDLRATIAAGLRSQFEDEAERALRFARDEYVPHGRALALFSSEPRDLFETFHLQVPVRSMARFRPRPYPWPLDAALDDYPRVVVALTNNEAARILTLLLGEIEGQRKVKDAVPGRQRQGGWSAFKYQRDREAHIETHFEHVAATLEALDRESPFERLVVAGTDEATAALAGLLPKTLAAKLAGSFRAEMFATDDEVAEKATAVAGAAERREETALAKQVVESALAGGKAALGWQETLQTLAEGRVHRLVLGAGRLGSTEADHALELAGDHDAPVEFVHGEAEEVLGQYEGVGAILRY
jgi:hypothetical protein